MHQTEYVWQGYQPEHNYMPLLTHAAMDIMLF